MQTTERSTRIASVDILRGIVMVIMALDHARDYFTDFHHDPTDLQHASTIMFFTRWITHFCAPVFIFLAGTSAMLSLSRGKTKKEAFVFLLTRGLWLLILENTVVRFGWQFNLDYTMLFLQVIWAIGWSMICLSLLIFLPFYFILTIGLLMIFGHNMLDHISSQHFGTNAIWWDLVHEQNLVSEHGIGILVIYPLIPWVGVMAVGYCFGKLLLQPQSQRNKWLRVIGGSAILLFIILRAGNIYGNTTPWHIQDKWWRSILSMLDCRKYPPSLLYLLMTLGPAIFVMPWLEQANKRIASFFQVYGRVPMFYYIMHIYLLHAAALVTGLSMGIPFSYFTSNDSLFNPSPAWGFPLYVVYTIWIAAVLALYYPCRWFMRIKMKHKAAWLSYL